MCAKLNETNVTQKVSELNIIYMTQQQRKFIEKRWIKKDISFNPPYYILNTDLILFMRIIRL